MKFEMTGLVAPLALLACAPLPVNGDDSAGAGMTVWNHAYQENYEADAIADITAQASDAYVLLDPFKDDIGSDPQALVRTLKMRNNEVGAYISVGTGEDWRDDFTQMRPSLADDPWGEWEGEYFVSTPDDAVIQVMRARIDLIAGWGFDWVEFDNMDWAFDQANRRTYALAVTQEQATQYFGALCRYVQQSGMKCMAKSTVEGAGFFDGVTYESYTDDTNWWEQAGAKAFLAAGKPVVIVHYDEPDCAGRYAAYRAIYGAGVSFVCEDPAVNGYVRSGF
jgi:endo-alpha-1,4-polygalactosaminidase (GH114 family)